MSYWSVRYLVILFAVCAVIALVSIYWIRENARDDRLQTSGLFVQNIAERVGGEADIEIPKNLDQLVENKLQFFRLDSYFCLMIVDKNGQLQYSMPKITQEEMEYKWDYKEHVSLNPEYASVSAPVYGGSGGEEIGRTVLLQSDESLTTTKSVVIVVVIMLIIFTLSGLLTIYLLASRLSLPLQQLTVAAKKIRKGNYSIGELRVQTQEKEISELVDSFSEMAARLKQLEEWRILSLAGVSHELKTPVTSIKGLIHAVKDDIVTGEEAEEFLDLALKETSRLDRMVADLLDYNAFAAGNVSLRSDRLELGALLNEVLYQWKLIDSHQEIDCKLMLPENEIYIVGDALRIRQIVVNLLNNCVQAKHPERELVICISIDLSDPDKVMIEIKDNGIGVSRQDETNIFERFYRGERKSARPHGLGLGLTYSQQLAQAQGGNLTLRSSSKEGTVFAITFPVA